MEEQVLPQRPSTHAVGEPSSTGYYQQILTAQMAAGQIPPEVRSVLRWSFLTMVLAPVSLWIAWAFTRAAISEYPVQANAQWLVGGWGISAALTAWQFAIRSERFIFLRKLAVAAVLAGTIGFGAWYAKSALGARANAHTTVPERVFAFVDYRGRSPFRQEVHWFQRADGTVFGGESGAKPLPDYSTVCASVQRLVGDYGFEWVRVTETSRPSPAEIAWPIRREDCFSNKPLSSLQG